MRKIALHWVVRAWREDGTGFTIDYGVTEVHGTQVATDEGLDEALIRALQARKDAVESEPYKTEKGETVPLDLTLIDAGWRTEAIYLFTRRAGLNFKPAMGFGKSSGCASANFQTPVRNTTDRKVGERWFLSRRPHGVWLVCMDADHWKAWEHDRWMSDPARAGALTLFGDRSENPERMSQDQKWHFSYGKHIVAEVEVEEVIKGRLERRWKSKSDNTHYLDASYMTDVAASMSGIRLLGKTAEVPQGSWYDQPSKMESEKVASPTAEDPDGWVSS